MAKSDKVLQLKITLLGTEPAIWRRTAISANSTFFDLHVATQVGELLKYLENKK